MLLLSACAPSAAPRALERVAFLSLDNLSGDDSLAWLSSTVPTIAAAQLTGVGRILPVLGATSREAAALAATKMVHGYFDRRGGSLHFEFSVEDATTHKMETVSVDGDGLRAAESIAKAVDSGAQPFSTKSAEAVQAWGQRNFERAIELDPDFGAAWLDLVQSKTAQPDLAVAAAERALARSTLRSPLDRARISLLNGQLRSDAALIGQASKDLVRLVPNDSGLIRRLAEEASNGRRFDQAVELYRKVLSLEPDDAFAYNLLGYAQFFAGDLAGARESFDEYAKKPGQQANGLDSQGEVLFMAGLFGEAETYFLQAHEAAPALLGGGDLLKAAYARWLSGDLPGADLVFDKYVKYRSENNDQTVAWRRANWEFATGRAFQAQERLQGETGPGAELAKGQLQVMSNSGQIVEQLTRDLAALEQAYRKTPPATDGFVRVLYARGLLKTGRKAEAEKLAQLWPLPETGQPALQPLLYPIYLQLRKDLAK